MSGGTVPEFIKPVPSNKTKIILDELRKLYPDARCGLDYRTPFELLIATILSAQCTDKRVNLITPALFAVADSPEKILKLGEKGLTSYIKTCGLYKTKARNILNACQTLVEKHGGKVPEDFDALTELGGVGRKTANVVVSNAFGVPAIAVDTHVFRVSRRLGLAKGKNPTQVELELQKAIPRSEWSEAHHLFIAHGRGLCAARNPRCEACPLTRVCLYYAELKKAKNRTPASPPLPRPRPNRHP